MPSQCSFSEGARQRAEARRAAGPPPPTLREWVPALALETGILRTRDQTAIGVPHCYLAKMCAEGILEKVGTAATALRSDGLRRL